MKTEATVVNGVMYVFAEPKTSWEIESLESGELPYRFTLKSYDYESEDSVRVCEFPVTGTVPAGIDITMKAIEGFREKIVDIQKDADRRIEKLEDKIKALLLITYQPAADDKPAVIDGTAEEVDDDDPPL